MPRPDRILSDLALSRSPLDRRSDLRADDTLLPRLLSDSSTRVARLVGTRMAVVDGDVGLRLALGGPAPGDGERLAVFLGEVGGAAYVGVVADDLADDPAADTAGAALRGLRQVGLDLGDLDVAVFCTLLALANWHRAHGHCPRCGAATEPALSGWIRRCPRDDSEHYPRTDVAVIMAVVDDDDRLLLARGKGFHPGGMSVLAGFVEPGEPLAGAVRRETFEETGVRVGAVTYLGDQPWPFPTSLMVGFLARAQSTELNLQDDEIDTARWFTRDELGAALADGSLLLSGRLSIARRLIEHWYGDRLDLPEATLR